MTEEERMAENVRRSTVEKMCQTGIWKERAIENGRGDSGSGKKGMGRIEEKQV